MSGIRSVLAAWFASSLVAVSAVAGSPSAVPGWFLAGSSPDQYLAAVDRYVARTGTASASLVPMAAVDPCVFGTLMQQVDARPHVGERLRFSAQLRTAGVKSGAALWMRIDGPAGEMLAFDNMSQRGYVRGDRDWTRYDLVLDVPPDSRVISFGVLLQGDGMVWIDDASLEPVPQNVATTGMPVFGGRGRLPRGHLPEAPANLDFED